MNENENNVSFESKLDELNKLKEKLHEKFENISENVTIGDYTYGNFEIREWDNKTKLKIGKFCSIANGVIFLLGGEHRSDFITTYPFNALLKNFEYIGGHPHTKGDITIGNDVWIGSEAKILSGVTINDGSIIGANSIVTKDVPPYSIVAGNPASIIKYRFEEETIEKLLKIKWWDFDEKEIINIIPLLQSEDISELIKRYGK